jgi:hypothetical protein
MAEADDSVRCWLVERDYNDKGLVTLVYATPDGDRYVQQHRSSQMLSRNGVTAATDVPADRLEPVDDDRRQRYAAEVDRLAGDHDPDDEV